MKTLSELESLNPCSEGLTWARSQPSLWHAWETCEKSQWMWWLLRRRSLCPKELSVNYSRGCADHVAHFKNYYVSYAAAADAAAAADVADAYVAAGYADVAAGYADVAERLWQANFLRTLVSNPFEKPEETT